MLRKETIKLQSDLGKYVRDGDVSKVDGVIEKRLHHYRRLVKNIVDDSLSSAFPITKIILSTSEWDLMINDFMKNHNSHEPQVWKYPYQLIVYFEESGYHEKLKKPFLLDLLKFEWMEMEVHGMEDVDINTLKVNSKNGFIINPYMILEHLTFPVFRKNHIDFDNYIGEYYLICYRNTYNLEIKYRELNTNDILILNYLQENLELINIYKNIEKIFKVSEEESKIFIDNSIKLFLEENILI